MEDSEVLINDNLFKDDNGPNGDNFWENSMCPTCLSKDRDFFLLDNVQKVLLTTLEIFIQDRQMLCWECYTIVKKICKFRVHATLAQTVLLQRNMTLITAIGSLSTLKSTDKIKGLSAISVNEDNFMITTKFLARPKLKQPKNNNNTHKLGPVIIDCAKFKQTDNTVSVNVETSKPIRKIHHEVIDVPSDQSDDEYLDVPEIAFDLKTVPSDDNDVECLDVPEIPFNDLKTVSSDDSDVKCLDVPKIPCNDLKTAKFVSLRILKVPKNNNRIHKLGPVIVDGTKLKQLDSTVAINAETSKPIRKNYNEVINVPSDQSDDEYLDVPEVPFDLKTVPSDDNDVECLDVPKIPCNDLKTAKFVSLRILKVPKNNNNNIRKLGPVIVDGTKLKQLDSTVAINAGTSKPIRKIYNEEVDVTSKDSDVECLDGPEIPCNDLKTTKFVSLRILNVPKNNNNLHLGPVIVDGTKHKQLDSTVAITAETSKPIRKIYNEVVDVTSEDSDFERLDVPKIRFNDLKTAKVSQRILKQLKDINNIFKLGPRIVDSTTFKQQDNTDSRTLTREINNEVVDEESEVNDVIDVPETPFNDLKKVKIISQMILKPQKNNNNTHKSGLKIVDGTQSKQPYNTFLIDIETRIPTSKINKKIVKSESNDFEFLDMLESPNDLKAVNKNLPISYSETIIDGVFDITEEVEPFINDVVTDRTVGIGENLDTPNLMDVSINESITIGEISNAVIANVMSVPINDVEDVEPFINDVVTDRTVGIEENSDTPNVMDVSINESVAIKENSNVVTANVMSVPINDVVTDRTVGIGENSDTPNVMDVSINESIAIRENSNAVTANVMSVPKNYVEDVEPFINDVVTDRTLGIGENSDTSNIMDVSINESVAIGENSNAVTANVMSVPKNYVEDVEPFINDVVTDRTLGIGENSDTSNVMDVSINESVAMGENSNAVTANVMSIPKNYVEDVEPFINDVVTDRTLGIGENSDTSNVMDVSVNESVAMGENSNAVTANVMSVPINDVEDENIVTVTVMGLSIEIKDVENESAVSRENCIKTNQSVQLVKTSDTTKIVNVKESNFTILESQSSDLIVAETTELMNNHSNKIIGTSMPSKDVKISNLSQLCHKVLIKYYMFNIPSENKDPKDISVDTINHEKIEINNSIQLTDVDKVQNAKENCNETQTVAYDDPLSPSILLCNEELDSSNGTDEIYALANDTIEEENPKTIEKPETVERNYVFDQPAVTCPCIAPLHYFKNVPKNPHDTLRCKTQLIVNRITDDYPLYSNPDLKILDQAPKQKKKRKDRIIDDYPLNLNPNLTILDQAPKQKKQRKNRIKDDYPLNFNPNITILDQAKRKKKQRKKEKAISKKMNKANIQLRLILLKSILSDHDYLKENFKMYKNVCSSLHICSIDYMATKEKLRKNINECDSVATASHDETNKRNDNDRQVNENDFRNEDDWQNEDVNDFRSSQGVNSNLLKPITDESENQNNNTVNKERSQNSCYDVNVNEVKVECFDPNYDDECPEINYQNNSTITTCTLESEESVKQEHLFEEHSNADSIIDSASEISDDEPAFNYYNNVPTNTNLSNLSYYDYLYRPVNSAHNSPRPVENFQNDFENLNNSTNDEMNKIIVCFSDPIFSTDQIETNEQSINDSNTDRINTTNTADLLEPLYYTDFVETYDHRQTESIVNVNNNFTDNNTVLNTVNITTKVDDHSKKINTKKRRKRRFAEIENPQNKNFRKKSKPAPVKTAKLTQEDAVKRDFVNELRREKLFLRPVVALQKIDNLINLKNDKTHKVTEPTQTIEEFLATEKPIEQSLSDEEAYSEFEALIQDLKTGTSKQTKRTRKTRKTDITTNQNCSKIDKNAQKTEKIVLSQEVAKRTRKKKKMNVRKVTKKAETQEKKETKVIDSETSKDEQNETEKNEFRNKNETVVEPNRGKIFEPDTNTKFTRKCNQIYTLRNYKKGEFEIMWENTINSDTFRNAEFKCFKCVRVFTKKLFLLNHVTASHRAESGNLACSICDCRYKCNVALVKHKLSHKKCYVCRWCPKEYMHLGYLKDHVEEYHPTEFQSRKNKMKVYTCSICQAEYTWYKSLYYHFRDNHNLTKPSAKKANVTVKSSSENNPTSTENASCTGNNLSSTENNISYTGNNTSCTENNTSCTGNNSSFMENNSNFTGNNSSCTVNNSNCTGNNSSDIRNKSNSIKNYKYLCKYYSTRIDETGINRRKRGSRKKKCRKFCNKNSKPKSKKKTQLFSSENFSLTDRNFGIWDYVKNLPDYNLKLTENHSDTIGNNSTSSRQNLILSENNSNLTVENFSTANNLSLAENNHRLAENNLSLMISNLSLTENNHCLSENNLSTENSFNVNEESNSSISILVNGDSNLAQNISNLTEDNEENTENNISLVYDESSVESVSILTENNSTFPGNNACFGETSESFPENNACFGENSESVPENNACFEENSESFPENNTTVSENHKRFSENDFVPTDCESSIDSTSILAESNSRFFGDNLNKCLTCHLQFRTVYAFRCHFITSRRCLVAEWMN